MIQFYLKGKCMSEEAVRRGRPRPESTITRDADVLKTLGDFGDAGATRNQLAEKLGVKPSEAYLALWRLNKAGSVAKTRVNGQHVGKLVPAIVE